VTPGVTSAGATIPRMALVVGDRPVRPLTADEVIRMVETGILGEDERVELLHGVLTQMSPKSPAHGEIEARLIRWLVGSSEHSVRVQHPLLVPDRTSLPEPDIAVVQPGDHLRSHPDGALLVIEVAFSSLATDTGVKPELYAAAGVPDYWVVDIEARRVRMFREPRAYGYRTQAVLGPDGFAAPLALKVPPLDLAALFCGL
jgi:Uma2 family endonuclease